MHDAKDVGVSALIKMKNIEAITFSGNVTLHLEKRMDRNGETYYLPPDVEKGIFNHISSMGSLGHLYVNDSSIEEFKVLAKMHNVNLKIDDEFTFK